MADIRRSVLEIFQQGMDTVNSAVNHVTNATRTKMDELTLQNRRKELLGTLAEVVYAQWQQGAQMPESLTEMLTEIGEVDAQLANIASQKQAEAAQKEPSAPEQQAATVADPDEPQPEQEGDLTNASSFDVKEEDHEEVEAVEEKEWPVPQLNIPPQADASEEK